VADPTPCTFHRSRFTSLKVDALQSLVTDANTLIPIINHWIHLLSAVIWIGGLAFLVMAVTPGLKKAVTQEQIKPITDAFYQHYKKVAGILLVVLLFTGGINFHYVNQVITSQTGSGIQHHAKYLIVFFIKLFLVLCLLTLFLYTVLFKSDDAEAGEEESYEAIPFQRAALWIGFFILLCASAMKHLHQ
jgi:putative copper export protein